jgi:hypothetical protein
LRSLKPITILAMLTVVAVGCGGHRATRIAVGPAVTPDTTVRCLVPEGCAPTTTTTAHVVRPPKTCAELGGCVPKTTTTTTPPVTVPPAPTTTTFTIGTAVAIGGDYRSWPDWPVWRCIGQHEQGAARGGPYDSNGDGIAWHGSPAGGRPGSGYPGGLGILRAAWDDARGAAGVTVTNGAYASPGDQILVARVIRERHGLHAWATASICGG